MNIATLKRHSVDLLGVVLIVGTWVKFERMAQGCKLFFVKFFHQIVGHLHSK